MELDCGKLVGMLSTDMSKDSLYSPLLIKNGIISLLGQSFMSCIRFLNIKIRIKAHGYRNTHKCACTLMSTAGQIHYNSSPIRPVFYTLLSSKLTQCSICKVQCPKRQRSMFKGPTVLEASAPWWGIV